MLLGPNPAAATSLLNFGYSVHSALPASFRGDTKSHRSILSGVYARGSKRSHQSALEMCNLLWTPPLLEKENSKLNPVYNTVEPLLYDHPQNHIGVVVSEGWSLVRDSYTNRNHCPSHEMWSYERDGRW